MRQPVYDGCAADRTQAVLLQGLRALRRLAANHRISNEAAVDHGYAGACEEAPPGSTQPGVNGTRPVNVPSASLRLGTATAAASLGAGDANSGVLPAPKAQAFYREMGGE